MAVKAKHGATLAGRYRLLERLGEGGMGSVWKAEHLLLDSHVAIKLVDPDAARSELNLGRFLREAKTLASLRSPHVVQVLDFGSDGEVPYLVMELLQGQTLGRRLAERVRLGLAETSRILNDVCSAIALVHEQGLIHRDLKPENIFLCEAGDRRIAKVVDFGIAKSLRGDMLAGIQTRTGHMLGTPSYMSPEQCRGLKDIDHRTDLWALGVIAYECLIGNVPFEGQVLGDLLLRICMDPLPVPSLQRGGAAPAAFDAWFARAVARDRARRFQSAAELAAAFAALSTSPGSGAGLAASAREEGAVPRASPGHSPMASAPERSAPKHSAPSHAVSKHSAPKHSAPKHSAPKHSAPKHSAPGHPVPGAPAVGLADAEKTTTTVGLVGPARRTARSTQRVALGAVAVVALLGGVWALGPRRSLQAEVSPSVEVQGLRPAYEPLPRVLHPRVQTGRRLSSAPVGAGPANAEAIGEAQRSLSPGNDVPAAGGVPLPAEALPAPRDPGNPAPASAQPRPADSRR